jgi:ubiquinone/menaquinone biosynthesis C-methylase UbiE
MSKQNRPVVPALQHNVEMYDAYYQKPDWWFRFRYDTQVKRKTCWHLLRLSKHNLKNQRILEIGFGSGAVLFSFDTSCELFGVEISRSAVDRATQKAKENGYQTFEFKLSLENTLPYPDARFDIVIASHVVEHVEDDRKLMDEIRRVLRPDGVAIILIPINENYQDPNHLRRYTGSQFMDLAKSCSFRVVNALENELLFHLVETFYFEEFNYRWKVLGPFIAGLFNFPTSVLPFWSYQVIERAMILLGWRPRQFGCVLAKQEFSPEGK